MMRILGLVGGLAKEDEPDVFHMGKVLFHDAAAALIENGRVVFATEEERLNRIKHTNRAPLQAIRACLDAAGCGIKEVDRIAYYADDTALTTALNTRGLAEVGGAQTFSQALRYMLERGLGWTIEPERVMFVRHHIAHAMSAFAPSQFEKSLILTYDAMGEYESGLIATAHGHSLEVLRTLAIPQSLGFLYADLIRFIGFEYQEEYKVMGLAPYGDPSRFRQTFLRLYQLLPDGEYRLHRERFAELRTQISHRTRGQPLLQEHRDFAASIQEMLESIVMHLLRHFTRTTGFRNLCLAGGVAQNCSLNGKLMYSGLFDRVFVQPASTDAGCAIGAALYAHRSAEAIDGSQVLPHVYLGRDIGDEASVLATLRQWESLVQFQRLSDVCEQTATLLAQGKVIGWMQGRSEFGPRALGNRSILADPRPAENRERINAVVKKREAFRPFAPAVLAEAADQYFEWPREVADLSFMTFVVKVRPEKQRLLGAVTHVDGTARVQTVAEQTNPKFWRLITEFGRITGVPVLLNTSFNNNAEPIVDSVADGLVCLMTTDLDAVVVGDWLVTPTGRSPAQFLSLRPRLSSYYRLVKSPDQHQEEFAIVGKIDATRRHPISAVMAELLRQSDGARNLKEMAMQVGVTESEELYKIAMQAHELWQERLITLAPPHH